MVIERGAPNLKERRKSLTKKKDDYKREDFSQKKGA